MMANHLMIVHAAFKSSESKKRAAEHVCLAKMVCKHARRLLLPNDGAEIPGKQLMQRSLQVMLQGKEGCTRGAAAAGPSDSTKMGW